MAESGAPPKPTKLTAEVWRNLVRLTAENISSDQLTNLLTGILNRPNADIFELTHDQASRLSEVLGPLPRMRKLLFEAAEPLTGAEGAEQVVQAQLDAIAESLLKNADFSLFSKQNLQP